MTDAAAAGLPRWSFGDSPAMADRLLALVLTGAKTATCWDARDGTPIPHVGARSVVLDGAGNPRVVVETVEIEQRRFDRVDAAIAADEGEGDRSLAFWRAAHRDYFERQGHFAPDMPVWCERFRIVERL